MNQITLILITLTTNSPLSLHANRTNLRIKHGVADTEGKYPYVVALILDGIFRAGTGTMLSPEWVLTAGHCLDEEITHIQYGNMTVMSMFSQSISEIIGKIKHPGFQRLSLLNDIGLCRVLPVELKKFGVLSALDYNSLMGKTVEYAGYGITHYPDRESDFFNRTLQVGEGIVVAGKGYTEQSAGPTICVAPKCSNKLADAASGDSGGPLFHDGKLVGIVSWGDDILPIGRYAAISPYLTWIHDVIIPPNYRRKFGSGKLRKRKYIIKLPYL